VAAYLDAIVDAARAHLPAEAELIIEPGRSMVAETACTVYRVVTVKHEARTFVAVDGGMGDNLEVALFEQRFEAGCSVASTPPATSTTWWAATARAGSPVRATGARWYGARPGTTCWRATSSPTRMGVLAHPGPG
jgi:hypothetical protein